MSGKRTSRSTPKIVAHNQCGGPKKQGLAPQSGFYRQGMNNLKIWKGCGCSGLTRLNNTLIYTNCDNILSTRRPLTSGGVTSKPWLKYR